MNPMLRGFAHELVKLSAEPAPFQDVFRAVKRETARKPNDSALSQLRGQGAPVSRDYLASVIIGGLAAPAVALIGKSIGRALANREVRMALRGARTPKQRRAILGDLHVGKVFGRARPGAPFNQRPLMTPSDAAASAAQGVIMSSAIQMLRDRFSGEASKKKDGSF